VWLNNLKKALILQEFAELEQLIDQMPAFDSINDMEQAAYLLQNVKILLESERSVTLHSLNQLKNALEFLKSTENTSVPTINLKL